MVARTLATAFFFFVVALPVEAAPTADGYDEALGQARIALENGRIDDARHLLETAEQLRPGSVLAAYYRAYCFYREGKFDQAATGFEQSLRLAPNDGWSAYMLALSLAKAGQPADAKARLERLKTAHAGDEIGTVSARTLAELETLEKSEPGPWAFAADLGVFSDSNPAFRADSSGTARTDVATSVSARGEYSFVRSRAHKLSMGLGAGETTYLARREGTDWTTFSGWLGYRWMGASTAWLASYRFAFSLYGYDPFTSIHTLATGLRVTEATWTMTLVDLEGMARVSHDPAYAYLAARGAGLTLAQEFAPLRGVRLRAGYAFRFENADPASVHQSETSTDQAGATHLLTADYRTDFSFWGHGPVVTARVPLIAGLSLEGTAEMSWRRFLAADRVAYANDGAATAAWEKRRADIGIRADGGLKWVLSDHLTLVLVAAYLRNLSTLGDATNDPIDRNYGRFTVGLWLRWALNAADL